MERKHLLNSLYFKQGLLQNSGTEFSRLTVCCLSTMDNAMTCHIISGPWTAHNGLSHTMCMLVLKDLSFNESKVKSYQIHLQWCSKRKDNLATVCSFQISRITPSLKGEMLLCSSWMLGNVWLVPQRQTPCSVCMFLKTQTQTDWPGLSHVTVSS